SASPCTWTCHLSAWLIPSLNKSDAATIFSAALSCDAVGIKRSIARAGNATISTFGSDKTSARRGRCWNGILPSGKFAVLYFPEFPLSEVEPSPLGKGGRIV